MIGLELSWAYCVWRTAPTWTHPSVLVYVVAYCLLSSLAFGVGSWGSVLLATLWSWWGALWVIGATHWWELAALKA